MTQPRTYRQRIKKRPRDLDHQRPADPIDLHVGQRLRDRRTSLSMSMDTLGAAIGVAYQQVQKYETGANRISASMLWRIAGTLGTGIGYFYDGLDAPGELALDADGMRTAASMRRLDHRIRGVLVDLIDGIRQVEADEGSAEERAG